jgi:hypothetical protein
MKTFNELFRKHHELIVENPVGYLRCLPGLDPAGDEPHEFEWWDPPIRQSSKNISIDEVIAFHEAGHAVIARVLAIPSRGAWLHDDGGHVAMGELLTTALTWLKHGKRRHPRAAYHADIIATMAGAEAERELLGALHPRMNDASDRAQIEAAAEHLDLADSLSWDFYERWFRNKTQTLVRRHWARIQRVAAALLVQKTLNEKELDCLIGDNHRDGGLNDDEAEV